jgi:flavin-dependent dehydrogenase
MYDVAVLGWGPAGALASLLLARAGLAVSVTGPTARPGHVPDRAETLSPPALDVLGQHGLRSAIESLGFPVVTGFLASWSTSQARFRPAFLTPEATTLLIDRARFDSALQTQAREAGVHHLGQRAVGLERTGETWRIGVQGQPACSARVVIDATGRGSRLARQVGGKLLMLDRLVACFHTADQDTHLGDRSVVVVPDADGWRFETQDCAGRGVTCRYTDIDLHRARERDPRVSAVWAAGSWVLESAIQSGLISIGDAAQTRDPLSSQGISSSLVDAQSAALAVMCQLQGDGFAFARHERARRQRQIDYLRRRHAFYRSEDRWTSELFWQRRHDVAHLRSLANLWKDSGAPVH